MACAELEGVGALLALLLRTAHQMHALLSNTQGRGSPRAFSRSATPLHVRSRISQPHSLRSHVLTPKTAGSTSIVSTNRLNMVGYFRREVALLRYNSTRIPAGGFMNSCSFFVRHTAHRPPRGWASESVEVDMPGPPCTPWTHDDLPAEGTPGDHWPSKHAQKRRRCRTPSV